MTGICNSFCMTRRIEMQLASLSEPCRLSLVCKALSISMLTKQKRTARWNAWSYLVIWLRLPCDLRQVSVWFASSYRVICVKLQHDSIEIAKWLGIYCTTDYLSLYDDNGYCVVRWVSCWTIPTFVPMDDNRCCVVWWVPCWTIPTFVLMNDNGCCVVWWGFFHVVTA